MAEDTKADKYEPTKAEEKLLEVLANPESRQLNVTEICQLASISRDTYYKAFAKPEFLETNRQLGLDLIKQQISPLINIGITEAKKGSFQHWKVLMEMGDMYTEKKKIDLDATVTAKLEDFF